MIQFMPTNHSITNCVITILIHSDTMHFQYVFITLLRRVAKDVMSSLLSWHKCMILMPQIFDVIANENAHYKRNELEYTVKTMVTVVKHYNIIKSLQRIIIVYLLHRILRNFSAEVKAHGCKNILVTVSADVEDT